MAKLNPIELATDIVRSFVSSNSLPRGDLPALIQAMHAAVKTLAEGVEAAAAVIAPAAPAVSIRKSLTPDYLICLEDGKRFKSLRRHLATLGMTPEQYREKWNLPSTYPMVAPNYSAQRSAMAKTIGLGQLRGTSVAAPLVSVEAVAPEPTSDSAIELGSPEPESVSKREANAEAKGKVEVTETTPAGTVQRKRGRPRNATV